MSGSIKVEYCLYQPLFNHRMNYLDQVEQELRKILNDTENEYGDEKVIRFVREKLLESFKNGVQAERNRGTPKGKPTKRVSK